MSVYFRGIKKDQSTLTSYFVLPLLSLETDTSTKLSIPGLCVIQCSINASHQT